MIDTINIINRKVSEQLNIDQGIVRQVNKYFWLYGVKNPIQSGKHTSIRVNKLGTLMCSRVKLYKKISRIIKTIRKGSDLPPGKGNTSREEYIETLYITLRLLLDRRNELAILYQTNNKNYELFKASMGEQITDNAGDSSQVILRQED